MHQLGMMNLIYSMDLILFKKREITADNPPLEIYLNKIKQDCF